MTNSSQFAWDFPGFKIESPTPGNPGKTGQQVILDSGFPTSIFLDLRRPQGGPSLCTVCRPCSSAVHPSSCFPVLLYPLSQAAVRAVEEGELSWHLWGQQAPYLGRRQAEDICCSYLGCEAHLGRKKPSCHHTAAQE